MNDEFDNETSQQTTSTLAKMKQGASKGNVDKCISIASSI